MAKNKLQKFAENAKFKHFIEAEFDEIFNRDYKLKGNWNRDFFKNHNPIVLELGCGKGEYTVGLAELFPNKNFIGIDIKGARMHKGALLVEERKIQNAAFLRTRIEFIESFFGKNEISEIWLTFPDPQMKKPTKRLSSGFFIKRYHQFLKADGVIHLKTDSTFLYTYTRELIKISQLPCIVDQTDLYNNGYADEILSLKTYYENQWLTKGIPIKYLKFMAPDISYLTEPNIEIEFDNYHSKGRGGYKNRNFKDGERTKGR
ncbi:MAG: tRNA (guanosine(46)-N7)-methyltransferase TrmB [Marinilabiliaceae bacterium]|nr:tRNA (guanosine(46)-N7)-methyltransferase TrmB [Marinilabiliaceae bacterium]